MFTDAIDYRELSSTEMHLIGKAFQDHTPDHLLLDSAPNIGPLISRWELDKFKNC